MRQMQTLSPIRQLDFVADALDLRSYNLKAIATASGVIFRIGRR